MMMSARSRMSLIALVFFSFFALSGFGCRSDNKPTETLEAPLVVWGLWQESKDMEPVIKAFTEQTGVEVEYRKIASVSTYEKMLLEALAEGRGPDIFVIQHTWVESKRGLMSPAPAEIIDERTVRDEFVEVVSKDLVRDGFVYGLPTSVDSLALFYNRDMLSASGIARPPQTWQDFQRDVEKIAEVTRLGNIQRSGAAIGTAANINRAPDILQLLMLQSGLPIYTRDRNNVSMTGEIGSRSLTFYTDFSNKSKKVYTWDLEQDYSIDAFAEGNTAMMLNYSYHIPTIQAKNPRLNFAVARVPQIADSAPLTFANYWPFAVSNTSAAPRTAWQFLRYMTNAQPAQLINEAQGAPPARRDSIEVISRDVLLGVFAEQSLIADTWPRFDIVATDAIFNKMIDDVVTGAASNEDALRRAEDQLNQLTKEE